MHLFSTFTRKPPVICEADSRSWDEIKKAKHIFHIHISYHTYNGNCTGCWETGHMGKLLCDQTDWRSRFKSRCWLQSWNSSTVLLWMTRPLNRCYNKIPSFEVAVKWKNNKGRNALIKVKWPRSKKIFYFILVCTLFNILYSIKPLMQPAKRTEMMFILSHEIAAFHTFLVISKQS